MHAAKRTSTLLVASAGGLIWGLTGYALLWGHTSIVIHRSFVVSPIGTILLLPVRVVLWVIHAVEGLAGGPFDFSGNDWWIGLAAGLMGALIAALVALAAAALVRAMRGSGGKGVPEASEGL